MNDLLHYAMREAVRLYGDRGDNLFTGANDHDKAHATTKAGMRALRLLSDANRQRTRPTRTSCLSPMWAQALGAKHIQQTTR